MTQLCPSCTSTELDDTQQFPKFARLIPSDAGTARSIISFAQQKNAESNGDTLRYMGVLYKNDAFGTAFYLALKESEFYWVYSSEFEGGDSDNADEYLKYLKEIIQKLSFEGKEEAMLTIEQLKK